MDDARALLLERLSPLPAETLTLTSALAGRVLAGDVHAAHDLPPFDNSAMDGFAVRAEDAGDELPVAGGSFAGDDPVQLEPHTAMTVATGAPLPPGADAVVPIELAQVHGERVSFSAPVTVGDHVRRQGTDLAMGAVVISAGSVLRPLALAAIATGGVAERRCHRRPRVYVVVTGDELVAPGEPLLRGQIHESNSILIAARCEAAGAEVVAVERVRDDAAATRTARRACARGSRRRRHLGRRLGRPARPRQARARRARRRAAVLAHRGAAGPPDLVRVARRARRGREPPGNPLSVMVGLELLLVPALRRLAGASDPGPAVFRMPLTTALRRDAGRQRVRPVRLVAEGAEPLGADLSHQLGRAAVADALALVPHGGRRRPAAGSLADLVDLR